MSLVTHQKVDPALLTKLATWGEGGLTVENHTNSSECPHCSGDRGSLDFMDLVVGYTTDPPYRALMKFDLGAFVLRCTLCGGKYWYHIHDVHWLEYATNHSKWPK